MNKINDANLAALMASRLNHDYVAPMTAISNSVELFALAPNSTQDCMDLITESVASAIELLKFYRIAFGHYDPAEEMHFLQLQKRIVNASDSQCTEIDMSVEDETILRSEAMLISLVYMCVRFSFSKLAKFKVVREGRDWVFFGEGEGAMDKTGEYRAEQHWTGTAKPSSSEVHFPYLLSQLDTLGYELTRKRDESGLLAVRLAKL